MNCWTCAEAAAAICRFCGRGTCRKHAEALPYVITTWSAGEGQVQSLVVEDAISCGGCRPHPAPVRLDLVLEEQDS